jgi:hypothetical protein
LTGFFYIQNFFKEVLECCFTSIPNMVLFAAVKKGFASLRPGCDFDRLAAAAEARSRADWLIGINATRAFSVRHKVLLSAGRVQTPTLALIANAGDLFAAASMAQPCSRRHKQQDPQKSDLCPNSRHLPLRKRPEAFTLTIYLPFIKIR